MIEINFKSHITDALHHFAEVAVETFFADILVIERRQHQHTRATVLDRLCGELDRFHERAAAGSRHHAQRIDPGRDQLVEQRRALFHRQRVRLAVRPEHGQSAVLRKQPLTMRDKTLTIRREIGLERGNDRRQHSADSFSHFFSRTER